LITDKLPIAFLRAGRQRDTNFPAAPPAIEPIRKPPTTTRQQSEHMSGESCTLNARLRGSFVSLSRSRQGSGPKNRECVAAL